MVTSTELFTILEFTNSRFGINLYNVSCRYVAVLWIEMNSYKMNLLCIFTFRHWKQNGWVFIKKSITYVSFVFIYSFIYSFIFIEKTVTEIECVLLLIMIWLLDFHCILRSPNFTLVRSLFWHLLSLHMYDLILILIMLYYCVNKCYSGNSEEA